MRAFGERVFEVIQQEPGRLREVTGIGPKRAERIIAGWAEQQMIRAIMLVMTKIAVIIGCADELLAWRAGYGHAPGRGSPYDRTNPS